jgi:triosephosphate isomerase
MKNIVAANWKMHGTLQQSAALVKDIIKNFQQNSLDNVETILCPPFLFLQQVAAQLQSTNIKLGAQDVSGFTGGAYTGQISAAMLKEFSCVYVIIGHSERRALCNEQDNEIAQKCLQAQSAGLTPILCVGETKSQYDESKTDLVVSSQLKAILNCSDLNLNNFILAYEPVWAIGTGLTATPEQAQAVHYLLREVVAGYDAELAPSVPIIYGGSVKPDNASGLFSQPDINGALVGGASLDADAFTGIVSAAN